jgi:hypothetical protein
MRARKLFIRADKGPLLALLMPLRGRFRPRPACPRTPRVGNGLRHDKRTPREDHRWLTQSHVVAGIGLVP